MPVHPIEFRYYYPEMKRIFEEESKLDYWLKVEAALAYAQAEVGNIPKKAALEIEKKANLHHVKLSRVKEIESEIDHDLMAVVKALSEVCIADSGKYVHLGATSYDIEDTAFALQIREAIKIISEDLEKLEEILVEQARKHRDTVCIGRTHGQHAIPTTYGLKFAVWACEVRRHRQRLGEVEERILVGKMTGAVGTQASFGSKGIEIQRSVMERLNLQPVTVSTQVVQRDRHAELTMLLALIAATLDKMAKEIRNLQRTEIAEVFEPFRRKQVGSSTMPQKRNPHKSERICSLARMIKSLVIPALDNVSLEHERDLTNSASERIIVPESFILLDYMLKQLSNIVESLEFNLEMINRNLEMTRGLCMSESIMIKLVEKGMGRQEAHELLRQAAHNSLTSGESLQEILVKDETVLKYLTEDELAERLDPKNYLGTAEVQVDNVVNSLTDGDGTDG
jgi:adenylosuccinate lyase